jgi:hypothetical protein
VKEEKNSEHKVMDSGMMTVCWAGNETRKANRHFVKIN